MRSRSCVAARRRHQPEHRAVFVVAWPGARAVGRFQERTDGRVDLVPAAGLNRGPVSWG